MALMALEFSTLAISCLALLLAVVTAAITMPFLSRRNQFALDGRTAIVTGGSQGMGLSVAKLISSKGANVVIVAQDVGKLERATGEITSCAKSPTKQRFHHLSFDLRDPASAPTILSTVTSWNNGEPPSIIFCCAGNCHPGFFASSSIDTLRSQMDTVYWSAAYMAHAALNVWLRPSSTYSLEKPTAASAKSEYPTRHIVLTSSTLAFFPVAGYAPYTPAKAAMKALADTLHQEVAVYNGTRSSSSSPPSSSSSSSSVPAADIKIHTVFPMGILSPGYAHENTVKPELTKVLEKDDRPQEPDEVARIAVEKLERGEHLITTMVLGHLLKGVGMGASARHGVLDVLWSWLGALVILFVGPDFVGKCRSWGKAHGMQGAR